MILENLLNMTNEEIIKWFRKETGNAMSNPEFIRRLAEYSQNIKNDFQTEWSQKKFKWFFKKYRKKKLMAKIYRRYQHPTFGVIEDIIEDIFSTSFQTDGFLTDFVDIKDISLGDKNYFVEENDHEQYTNQ